MQADIIDRLIFYMLSRGIASVYKNQLPQPSLKGGCTPKVQDYGNKKGYFSFVTKAGIMELVLGDFVRRPLSSRTNKAL